MSEEFTTYIQIIRQQIDALYGYIISTSTQQQQASQVMEELAVSLANLQLYDEERQTSLELMEVTTEELLGQNNYLARERQLYYDLFQFAPDAYLLTDVQGMILTGNRAAAALFNISQDFLVNKPLINFVVEKERSVFRTKLNQLPSINFIEEWEVSMCPRGGEPFDASLMLTPIRDLKKLTHSLRISIRNVTKYKQHNLQQLQHVNSPQLLPEAATAVEIPRSLDGLQVLFVDDETDAREFITVVLEQHGMSVTAVATVAQAIRELEQSRPDVILSDIRMPDEDGYALIQKVKAIEAEKGWQIPTAALTAYLAEDRAKAIKAGFQSHLHKLAEPRELVAMVAQLAQVKIKNEK